MIDQRFRHWWIYGQYKDFWKFNFEKDESSNSKEVYDQIIADTLGYVKTGKGTDDRPDCK